MTRESWRCEYALVENDILTDVTIEFGGGVITRIGTDPDPASRVMPGVVLPGLANCHSHAFHRALRGRTHSARGSFWTWREQMYRVADRLNPDTYYDLACATYAEMALAGITAVGEFHYLHHGRGGTAYDEPNAMGAALLAAAAHVGIRITLLDTCYVAGDIGADIAGPQRRFSDGDAEGWAERVTSLSDHHRTIGDAPAIIGAAIHSVRGVPAEQIPTVAAWASERSVPLHAHLSEQVRENEASLAHYGRTPTAVLDDAGALGPRTSVVHATHVSSADIALLGQSRSVACFCPTTERDLADGIGPAGELVAAGSPLSLGSDSHAVIDIFEEARAVELNSRLATMQRGRFDAATLLHAATAAGQGSLGWDDAGVLRVGARADLVALSLDSVRLAGLDEAAAVDLVVFAGSAADVTDVVVEGQSIIIDRAHHRIDNVPEALRTSIGALL